MSARAAQVEVLTQKSHFGAEVALGVTEAIDMAIADAQPVTVPVLDARFAAFESKMDARFAAFESKMDARFAAVDARFEAFEARVDAKLQSLRAELVRWVFLVMLGNVALTAGAHAVLHALQRGA